MKVIKRCITCVYCVDPFDYVDVLSIPTEYKLVCAHPKKHKNVVLEEFGKTEDGVTLFKFLCGGKEIDDERKQKCEHWSVNQSVIDDAINGFIKLD